MKRIPLVLVLLFGLAPRAAAQPTYRLDVKAEFRPHARLRLDGGRITRTAVTNDPGFRLQYHFKKDGKTAAVAEARRQPRIEPPLKAPGLYSVVLEVFYPAYKGGTAQKGQFRPVSNVLTYRVEPGSPPQLTRVAVPPPLAVKCAAGAGVLLEP